MKHLPHWPQTDHCHRWVWLSVEDTKNHEAEKTAMDAEYARELTEAQNSTHHELQGLMDSLNGVEDAPDAVTAMREYVQAFATDNGTFTGGAEGLLRKYDSGGSSGMGQANAAALRSFVRTKAGLDGRQAIGLQGELGSDTQTQIESLLTDRVVTYGGVSYTVPRVIADMFEDDGGGGTAVQSEKVEEVEEVTEEIVEEVVEEVEEPEPTTAQSLQALQTNYANETSPEAENVQNLLKEFAEFYDFFLSRQSTYAIDQLENDLQIFQTAVSATVAGAPAEIRNVYNAIVVEVQSKITELETEKTTDIRSERSDSLSTYSSLNQALEKTENRLKKFIDWKMVGSEAEALALLNGETVKTEQQINIRNIVKTAIRTLEYDREKAVLKVDSDQTGGNGMSLRIQFEPTEDAPRFNRTTKIGKQYPPVSLNGPSRGKKFFPNMRLKNIKNPDTDLAQAKFQNMINTTTIRKLGVKLFTEQETESSETANSGAAE